MKQFIILSVVAVFAASCASQKYSRTGNITDDVYFSPKQTENAAQPDQEEVNGFSYDQNPVTTNPNAQYRYYQGAMPDPDTISNSVVNNTTYNNYFYQALPAYPAFSYGLMYSGYGYNGWGMGMNYGFGMNYGCGWGYNPYYYGASFCNPYSGFGYCSPWGFSPYCGNPYWGYAPFGYGYGWNYGGTNYTPTFYGPRTTLPRPMGSTIIDPNGQRVRMSIPRPLSTTPPASASPRPIVGAIAPNVGGQAPHNNDGNRVVYPRQHYSNTPPASNTPHMQPPQRNTTNTPQVQPPPVRNNTNPPQVQPPARNNTAPATPRPAPVYRPQNNPPAPQTPTVPSRPENVRPGNGSGNSGGGTVPRRR